MASKSAQDLSEAESLTSFLDSHVAPLIDGDGGETKLVSLASIREELLSHLDDLEKQITLSILRAPQTFKEIADEIARNHNALQRLGI